MNDREKLKRIVEKAAFSCLPSNTQPLHINMLTTALLANGVTIQRWIPVTERLPNEDDADEDFSVLAIHKATKRRSFHWRTVADNPFDFTHWMPLPQPPKGE